MAIDLSSILLLFCISVVHAVGQFRTNKGLEGQICSSETENRVENVPTKITCGAYCSASVSCRSFFFNTASGLCVWHDRIFYHGTPGNECEVSENTLYYYNMYNAGHCNAGYTWYSASGYCYKYNPTCSSWNAARDQCRADGGDLIMLKTAEERDCFSSVLKGVRCKNHDSTWLGATMNKEGKWTWVDGTPADSDLGGIWEKDISDGNCLLTTKKFAYTDGKCSHKIGAFACAMLI